MHHAADDTQPSGDGLRCRVGAGHDWTILVLEGELDFSQIHTARQALLSLPFPLRGRLALDLRGLTFMDTSGIRLILEAMHRADEFALVRGPDAVHDVLELVGLADQLRVVPDPAALAVRPRPVAPPPAAPPDVTRRRARGRAGDVLRAIGHTPLVELARLSPKPGVRVWAKLESHNPTGSVKDRVARALIEDAEETGALRPGQTILEPTSGNTGLSLAMVCAHKGYRLHAVMPDDVAPERVQLLRAYGAGIVPSPAAEGPRGAVALALEMARADASYHVPNHYGNRAGPLAHYTGTAAEILDELPGIRAFVAPLGTGATLTGIGRRLREELGDGVQVVAAEPMRAPRPTTGGFADPSLPDRRVSVATGDAIAWSRRLLAEAGVFAGISSGAAASVAVRIASELDEGDVAFMVCDGGWRYLSAGIYTQPVAVLAGAAWW